MGAILKPYRHRLLLSQGAWYNSMGSDYIGRTGDRKHTQVFEGIQKHIENVKDENVKHANKKSVNKK